MATGAGNPPVLAGSNQYQRHIDGLRAVAVLSVIFYHFGQTTFSGGFVGVDVFFVISGYLITNLIINEINQTGSFDFKRFYIRRMRRLFPAMAVTFTATFIFAALLFPPERLQPFGQSLAAAVLSVSNIHFWTESGYFDVSSHLKPLLHTWSLGVEEQFYLIWPAVLWLFARNATQSRQLYVLAAVGLASFGLNYLWVTGNFDAEYASTIFYLTPFRMFELVIGALAIFLMPILMNKRLLHELFMFTGLALITFSVFSYNDDTVIPYLHALPPCIGALLVILSRESRIFGYLLTNPIAVWIGLISYSMYLVHWPVMVLYEYYIFDTISRPEAIGLFCLTILLSALLYYFVEKRYRRYSPDRTYSTPQRTFVLSGVATMLVIAFMGIILQFSEGRVWGTNSLLSVTQIREGKQQRYDLILSGCTLLQMDDPDYCKMDRPHQILVFGNSHEPDGYNAFARVYEKNSSVNLISFGTLNKCNVQITETGPVSQISDRGCDKRVALLGDNSFTAKLDGIVFSANQPFAGNKVIEWSILRHLKTLQKDIPLVVLGGYINTTHECAELINRLESFAACRKPEYVSYNPFIEQPEFRLSNPVFDLDYLYIDKARLLCSVENSLESCDLQAGDEPAFYDQHHLSLSFASLLGQRIVESYSQDLVQSGFPSPIPRN